MILKDINFKINKGDSIGFLGESGSGKSTIVKLLLGLEPIMERIFNDNNLNNINVREMYENMVIFIGTLSF